MGSYLASSLALSLWASTTVALDCSGVNQCVNYGIDFQPGGTYFQNESSTDDFTFVTEFEGCETDIVDNILVNDSNDVQYLCTNTTTTPDDADQLSTCPIEKADLTTGDWSLLIISNNGDACPIAYEIDFSMTVGIPATTTYTPTVTLPVVVTPISNYTVSQTTTDVETTSTIVTWPSKTLKRTTTITPHRVMTTKTITAATVRKTKTTAVPTLVTKTVTQSCSIPPSQYYPNPTATITPKYVYAAALATDSADTAAARRRDVSDWISGSRSERVARRNAHNEKRGVDVPTLTITDTNTADWPTITSTSYAPTSTITITTQVVFTSWTTSTSTSYKGVTVLSQKTVTAPTPTKTQIRYTVVTSTVATVTLHPTVTIHVHTAPAKSTRACAAQGGKLVG